MDIRVVSPDGTRHKRERKHAPISSRTRLSDDGLRQETRVVRKASLSAKGSPTRRGAHPDNSPRASSTATLGRIGRNRAGLHPRPCDPLQTYLIPAFGRRHVDAIKSEDAAVESARSEIQSPKTVFNILAVLSILLKKAV